MEDNAAFEELCRRLAAAPSCGLALPRAAGPVSSRMERLEDLVQLLWPYFGALDPACAAPPQAEAAAIPTSPFFVAVMMHATRYALRDMAPGRTAEECRRFSYLGACMVLRILHDSGRRHCAWIAEHTGWAGAGPRASLPAETPKQILEPYCAAACESEARRENWGTQRVLLVRFGAGLWSCAGRCERVFSVFFHRTWARRSPHCVLPWVVPCLEPGERTGPRKRDIPARARGLDQRSGKLRQVPHSGGPQAKKKTGSSLFPAWRPLEAMVSVQTEYLAVSGPRLRSHPASDRSDVGGLEPAMLLTLAETFPQGLPPRLLVLGSGGTGKTVLSKQIVVDLCSSHLASDLVGVVPFRLVLQDVGRILEHQAGWQVIVDCCSETHGPDSIHAVAARVVETMMPPVLLVLDGLDEAFSRRRSKRPVSDSKRAC